MVSPAQLRVLRQLATTNAVRCRRPHGQPWVWLIDGKAESGGVDRLLRRRLAETVDHDTVRITERGRQVLREAAYGLRCRDRAACASWLSSGGGQSSRIVLQ